MNKLILTTLISAGLTAAVPHAIAQAASPEGGPQAQQLAHRQHHKQRAFRSPVDRIEARLAYLKTALKITGTQEAQWNTYAEVRRKQAGEAAERRQAYRAQKAEQRQVKPRTAIERMERRQARLAAVSTRLDETLKATKPLYNALSPDQQKIADELLAPRGRGGFHRHGGHRRA